MGLQQKVWQDVPFGEGHSLGNEIPERPKAYFHKSTMGKGDILQGSQWGQGDTVLKFSFLASFWALWEPRQTDAQMEL